MLRPCHCQGSKEKDALCRAIASTSTEGKDGARARVLPKHLLGHGSQALDSLPHVGDTTGHVNANTGAGTDHAVSAAAIRRLISPHGRLEGKRSVRPLRKLIVTSTVGNVGSIGGAMAA